MPTGSSPCSWLLVSSLVALSAGVLACGTDSDSPPDSTSGQGGDTSTAGPGGSPGTSGTAGSPAGHAGTGETAGKAGESAGTVSGGAAGSTGEGGAAGTGNGMSGSSGFPAAGTSGSAGSSGSALLDIPLPSGFCAPALIAAPVLDPGPCATFTLDGILELDAKMLGQQDKALRLTAIRGPTPSAVLSLERAPLDGAQQTFAVGALPLDAWGPWTPEAVGQFPLQDEYLALAAGSAGDGTFAALMAFYPKAPPFGDPVAGSLRLASPTPPGAFLQPSVELFPSGRPLLFDRASAGFLAGSLQGSLALRWLDCDASLAHPVLPALAMESVEAADAVPRGDGVLLAVATAVSKGISTPEMTAPQGTRVRLYRVGGKTGDGSLTDQIEVDGQLHTMKLTSRSAGAHLLVETSQSSALYPVDDAGKVAAPPLQLSTPFERAASLGNRIALVSSSPDSLLLRTITTGVESEPMTFPVAFPQTQALHLGDVLGSPMGNQLLVVWTEDGCSLPGGSQCLRGARFTCADGSP